MAEQLLSLSAKIGALQRRLEHVAQVDPGPGRDDAGPLHAAVGRDRTGERDADADDRRAGDAGFSA